MLIRCPKCRKTTEIEHVERGRRVECVCRHLFVLDDSTVVNDYSQVDEAPPAKIGPYRIERLIGRGGMGKVFKGIHPTLNIPVAVKTLLNEYAANSDFKSRFIKSAKICAKLNHPNIVKVYDFGSDGETLYLVLEYIGGGSCHDLLTAEEHLTPEKVAEIASAVCNGLIEAEKYGIVHRDIKPDNIMRSADGDFKLSDLGLAKMERRKQMSPTATSNGSETVQFSVLGTMQYMSPEQIIDAKGCDIRADIYSLGVTMYQLISGHLPFESSDPEELRRMQLEDEAVVPSEIIPEIPLDMEYIIMRCMQKDKSERYQTPGELKADLTAFLEHEMLPSVDPARLPQHRSFQPATSVPQTMGRHLFRAVFWGIVTFFMVTGAYYMFELASRWTNPVPVPDAAPYGEVGVSGEGTIAKPRRKTEPTVEPHSPVVVPSAAEAAAARQKKYWEYAEEVAAEAMRRRDNYDTAINNFEAYLENPEYREKAQAYILRLKLERDSEVKKIVDELVSAASAYVEQRNYDAAARIFEEYQGSLRNETDSARKNLSEPYREKADKEKAESSKKQFLSSLARLLCGGQFDYAIQLYEENGGEQYLPRFMPVLEELNTLSDRYAQYMKKRIGKVEYLTLQHEFCSVTVLRVNPPEVSGEYMKKGKLRVPVMFTLNDLEDQDIAAAMQHFVQPDTRYIWMGSRNCRTGDFHKAMNNLGKVSFLGKEFQQCVEMLQAAGYREDLRKALQQIFQKASGKEIILPEADTLLNPDSPLLALPVSKYEEMILQMTRVMNKYKKMQVESPYLNALPGVLEYMKDKVKEAQLPEEKEKKQ